MLSLIMENVARSRELQDQQLRDQAIRTLSLIRESTDSRSAIEELNIIAGIYGMPFSLQTSEGNSIQMTFTDSANRVRTMQLKDNISAYIQVFRDIQMKTRTLYAQDSLAQAYPSLIISPVDDSDIDIGAFLMGQGVTAEESSWVGAYEELVDREKQARETLNTRRPGNKSEVISLSGGSAVVYLDREAGTVHKVLTEIRETGDDYTVGEIDFLTKMKGSGLTPEYRGDTTSDLEAEVRSVACPLVVSMEYIEIGDSREERTEDVEAAIEETLRIIQERKVQLGGDVEFVWDKKNHKIRLIDVGGSSVLENGEEVNDDELRASLRQQFLGAGS